MSGRNGWTLLGWTLAVTLLAAAVIAPKTLRGGWLSPDSIEHLAIAHAWTEGAGFVDPVQWHYHLDRSPPLPAAAARPPLVPLLAALPLAAGATIPTVIVLHAAWSAVVVGAAFLLAVRSMRPPAAAAAALLLATMPAWEMMATNPLTEVTATACYLLVLATADHVTRSVRGALGCAAATLLAALARPNFGAIAVAVLAAAVWEVRSRAAWRLLPLWAYGLGVAGGMTAIDAALRATTGEGLYAAYGVVTEVLSMDDAWRYDRVLVGGWTFVHAHAPEIVQIIARRIGQLHGSLFVGPDFHRLGWLAVPAVAYGLLRPRDGFLAHRIDAFAILGFTVMVVTYYADYARMRFALPIAVPACLTGLALLDAGARRLEVLLGRRVPTRHPRLAALGRLPGVLPLGIVLAFMASAPIGGLPSTLPAAWRSYRIARGTGPRPPGPLRALPDLCARFHPDAVVATSLPWQFTLWCGNATVRLPIDPVSAEVRDRFVAERRPGYIVLKLRRYPLVQENTARWRTLLDASKRFRSLAAPEGFALYEVLDPPYGSRPWTAPGPVACAGLSRDCVVSRANRTAPTARPRSSG